MTEPADPHARAQPPFDGDEVSMALGFLDYQRATFAWKTSGLDDDDLARALGPSPMTLGGMIKHLAYVEDDWFGRDLFDEPRRDPWAAVDWAADPDWEWHSAAGDTGEELRALWAAAVERSRSATARAIASGGLARRADRPWPDGRAPTLRWIILHMIEEYARHNGQADLIRESIDGLVGE